jgi:TonB-dependent starch-binding outer membrane protein SusC
MSKTLLSFPLLLGLMLLSVSAFAQRTLSGTVTSSEDGSGIPGAYVLLKGTSTGTTTDVNGKYSISVPDDPSTQVTFSSIGYFEQVRAIGSNASLDVVMQINVVALNETVVVGYGIQTRKQITGSVATIKADAFNNVPAPSFDQMLQGRASGVQVVQSAGTPGAATRVRIRGQQSISGSSDPLYVIDGVIINNDDFSAKKYGATSAVALNPLASINPNDIENIEVLKDASAGAIYGARAANGVIIVTTKKGKSGKGTINIDYNFGISNPARKLKFLEADDLKSLWVEAYQNDSINYRNANGTQRFQFPQFINGIPLGPNSSPLSSSRDRINYFLSDSGNFRSNTNWLDEVFRTGSQQTLNLSFRGGNERSNYYIAGDYLDNNGFLKGNRLQRITIRTNVEGQLNDWLKVGTQTSVSNNSNDQVRTSYNGGLGAAQSSALPFFPVYNPNGSYYGTQFANPTTGQNPVAQREDKFNTGTFRVLGNVFAEIKLSPSLTIRNELGVDFMNQLETFIYSPINRYYQNRGLGGMDNRRVSYVNFNNNIFATYNKSLLEDKIRLNIVVGANQQNYTQKDIGFDTRAEAGFTDPNFVDNNLTTNVISWSSLAPAPTVAGGSSYFNAYNSFVTRRYLSYFARPNITFLDKYVIQGSYRLDGSSDFGENNRYGGFYSIGGNWIFSEENFVKRLIPFLDAGKLRVSFGKVGNANFGGNYLWSAAYDYQNPAYNNQQGLTPRLLANPDLSWEKVNQIDIGLEQTYLKGRLTLGIGYYSKYSPKNNATTILQVPVQISGSGFGTTTVNSRARVRNRGFEFDLETKNIVSNNGGFTWTTNINAYTVQNKLLFAAGIAPDGFSAGIGDGRAVEGQPLGVSYLMEYLGIDSTGVPVVKATTQRRQEGFVGQDSLIRLDANTPTSVFSRNRKAFGSPFPKLAGGITNSFSYKGVTLSILAVFSIGNTIYDDGGKYLNGGFNNVNQGYWTTTARYRDGRWVPGKTNANYTRATLNPFDANSNNSTQWLYRGDYLRIRNIQLNYDFPQAICKRLKLDGLSVYAQGQNVLTFTKFPGWDPEVVRYADGGDAQSRANQSNLNFSTPYLPTPQARTFILGFRVRL